MGAKSQTESGHTKPREGGRRAMTITLTPDQERAIQEAIRTGVVRSIDEFIETAIKALPRREAEFDVEKARQAGARIRELRKGRPVRPARYIDPRTGA